jgi:Icc-related predicted phosphoesterase
MKILICSDFHGKISIVDSIINTFQEISPDIISFCGDAVKGKARGTAWLRGQAEGRKPDMDSPEIILEAQEDHNTYQTFFPSLNKIGVPVIVIPGNMDAPESLFFSHLFDYEMSWNNIKLVQENIFFYNEFFFSGFGGEITENELERDFVLQYPVKKACFFMRKFYYLKGKKILMLHTPPKSKLDFEKGTHKGFFGINKLIEWLKPDFVFCGHAHRARGEEWLGKSLVINPGPLKDGYFALLDTEEPNVQFEQIKL